VHVVVETLQVDQRGVHHRVEQVPRRLVTPLTQGRAPGTDTAIFGRV
jgi:hypothetical protein